jgi:putative component of membrane protein insertase Oxa1/YidC/SpoIIIJ protein YidD
MVIIAENYVHFYQRTLKYLVEKQHRAQPTLESYAFPSVSVSATQVPLGKIRYDGCA